MIMESLPSTRTAIEQCRDHRNATLPFKETMKGQLSMVRKIMSIDMKKMFLLFIIFICVSILHTSTLDNADNGAVYVKRKAMMQKEYQEFLVRADEEERSIVMNEKQKSTAISSFLNGLPPIKSVALVNMEVKEWWEKSTITAVAEEVRFERISANKTWKDFFPEWIDEEEKDEVPSCPKISMPDFDDYQENVDLVVVKLPCSSYLDGKLAERDLFWLQVHLVAANVAVRMGRRGEDGKVRVIFKGQCRPMMEVFRCDDMVRRDGEWWLYEAEVGRLEAELALPVGSCKLALSLKKNGPMKKTPSVQKPEAYATMLHSSDRYVCGAITLAQSLLRTGTKRDLILLHDDSIPTEKLKALAMAGWKLQLVTRIRNPHAKEEAYNAYNYTKLRLWQLIRYGKVVFIDADVLVLRNIDFVFRLPELSATGNDKDLFNSGVMVIEPSDCTFRVLMDRTEKIVPYNGGDQGFLNEVFIWWHRLPRQVNFMKNFWSNTSEEVKTKDRLFRSDPPELYSIHYLGMKPWTCYRDYDCNWNLKSHHVYASDAAHRRWWMVYDHMPKGLQRFCLLTPGRKKSLERHQMQARNEGYDDGHWKIRVTDRRAVI